MPGYKIREEYFNSVIETLSKNLLLYPYNNKTGKDMSDLIRGQIIGVTTVFKLMEAIDQFEKNKKEYDEFLLKLQEGANS